MALHRRAGNSRLVNSTFRMSALRHAALPGACCRRMGMPGAVPVARGWRPVPGASRRVLSARPALPTQVRQ